MRLRCTPVAISSGVYTLAGVLIGGFITTASQVYFERRRERCDERSEQRTLRAARRKIAAELFDIAIAARTVWTHGRADENYIHLLGDSEPWHRHAPLLAGDDGYVPVHLAYLYAGQTGRALDRGDRTSAVHYALANYDQIRVALQRIDESGASDLPELPSRFQDDAEDDPVQPLRDGKAVGKVRREGHRSRLRRRLVRRRSSVFVDQRARVRHDNMVGLGHDRLAGRDGPADRGEPPTTSVHPIVTFFVC